MAEDVPDEARRVKKVLNPHMPTNAEREEHVLTHLPYRNWCRHCVRGRGKEAAHTSMEKDRGNGVGEFSLDYAFPATEDGDGMTLLVVRERETRMTCSMQVPRKGSTGLYASKRVVAFIREVGYEDCTIIMKTDGEAALKAVVDEVARMRGTAKTIREEAPYGGESVERDHREGDPERGGAAQGHEGCDGSEMVVRDPGQAPDNGVDD